MPLSIQDSTTIVKVSTVGYKIDLYVEENGHQLESQNRNVQKLVSQKNYDAAHSGIPTKFVQEVQCPTANRLTSKSIQNDDQMQHIKQYNRRGVKQLSASARHRKGSPLPLFLSTSNDKQGGTIAFTCYELMQFNFQTKCFLKITNIKISFVLQTLHHVFTKFT